MGTAPVGRLILSMSAPPVCSMFMQYSYNFVDSAFVAQLSEKALAAVSLSFPITSLMCACSIGLGVGINMVIARILGRRGQDKAHEGVTLGILLASVVGMISIRRGTRWYPAPTSAPSPRMRRSISWP